MDNTARNNITTNSCLSLNLRRLLALCLVVSPGATFAESIIDGAQLVQLTKNGKSRAWSWAWRGDRIAYLLDISNTQSQLRIMNSDGSDDRDVSPVGNPFFAEWSWNGDRLSYEFANQRERGSQGGVFIYDDAADKSIVVSQSYNFGSLFGFFRGSSGRSGGRSGGRSRRSGGSSGGQNQFRPGLSSGPSGNGPYWSADDNYVAFSVRGSGSNNEVWVVDSATGEYNRILSTRGEVSQQRWSPGIPGELSLTVSAGDGRDIATTDLEGKSLTLLTNIGSDSIRNRSPRWSPTGEWISFVSDMEMTEQEQERGRSDIWLARPDGSGMRNLTNASTNVTEEQLQFFDTQWSWDGKWMRVVGNRFDRQGRSILSTWLMQPSGESELILTSDPETTGEIERAFAAVWSNDSTKLALTATRNRVRNWANDPEFEDSRSVLLLYDVETKQMHELLEFSQDADHKRMTGRVTWSPDSKSMVLSIEKVISEDEGITQPDVYRLDLPSSLVSPKAARFDGPPFGRKMPTAAVRVAENEVTEVSEEPVEVALPATATPVGEVSGDIVTIVEPQHLTVDTIGPLLPDTYSQYLKTDTSRNLFVFVGPEELHRALLRDMAIIDFPPAQIVVDLLAIETSDDVNRQLGLDYIYSEGRIALFQPAGLSIRDLTPGVSVLPPFGIRDGSTLTDGSLARRFGANRLTELTLGGLATIPNGAQSFYSGIGKLPREFFVRLESLQRTGEITILANPRTVATSGKESVIQIRRVVNFFFTEGVNFTTGAPNVRKSDVTATTEGRILPTLLASGKIHMVVDVNIGTVTFGAEDLPQQTDRKATTEVTVWPGETIAIGGLRQQEYKVSNTSIPIISKIPYLGRLFRKTQRETRHSVLTILITPRVLGQPVPESPLPDPDWPVFQLDDRYKAPIVDNASMESDDKKSKKKRRRNGSRRSQY